MRIPLYQIDAFTSRVFAGNPAAVCPLDAWLEEATLQAIAAENNLSETAFFVGARPYAIRWFTPTQEVDLCGHATLASAYVIMDVLKRERDRVSFSSRSGALNVTREGELLALDFPARAPVACEGPPALREGLGRPPREVWASPRDYLAVYNDEEEVRALRPHMDALRRLDLLGVIATAPGRSADFVSRFFAPRAGVDEDPVTGSAHCTLIPYWTERLGKPRLHALQVSARGGELFCEQRGDRVSIAGRAVKYLEGVIEI